ncbi:expressed protein [Phakopsora pachyrhizi]|uniref:Expressed protein n=1 Tax=Phakopsora pachyrhizi TaxID=170000 RepID=A0AAV0AMC7_PHAPC|nr:expressed protein [Phakopsora pachyrhizi]
MDIVHHHSHFHRQPTPSSSSSLEMDSPSSIDRVLQRFQDLSSITFSSFLIIHLSSPILASFVDHSNSEQLASRIQLAARVYYQDSRLREYLIVGASLAGHVLIGIIRRIRKVNRLRRIRLSLERDALMAEVTDSDLNNNCGRVGGGGRGDQDKEKPDRPVRGDDETPYRNAPRRTRLERLVSFLPRNLHSVCAYLSIPFIIDHIYSHRLAISSSSSHLGQIDYRYVSYLLRNRQPILSIVKYSILVSTVSFHSIFGIVYLTKRYLYNSDRQGRGGNASSTDGSGRGNQKVRRQYVSIASVERSRLVQLSWLGIVGSVGIGLRKISKESIPIWLIRRFDSI